MSEKFETHAAPDWSNSETGPCELWKNPLRPMAENLQVADGAIHFREKVISNLRKRITEKNAALLAALEALEENNRVQEIGRLPDAHWESVRELRRDCDARISEAINQAKKALEE